MTGNWTPCAPFVLNVLNEASLSVGSDEGSELEPHSGQCTCSQPGSFYWQLQMALDRLGGGHKKKGGMLSLVGGGGGSLGGESNIPCDQQ